MDALANGRRVKCLTVVDDFTKEAVDIVVTQRRARGWQQSQRRRDERIAGKAPK
ncbi:hypothetical protein FHX57_002836 [Paraburkholderia tropica]|nr:hypothetical protein [Paraburkholderia tropica]MBB3000484.1 hypothetical protein [Paraburkholderia tropica]MBB6320113.1 hypothetical protein [Paraburkholderia tropica]